MNLNSSVISDDQGGVSLGSVSNYVTKFKKIDAGEEVLNVPEFTSVREKIVSLPPEWAEETEKEILTHYYRRFGDHTCTDFQDVSPKVAQNVNRLFKKTLSAEEVQKKLEAKVSIEDVTDYDAKVQLPSSKKDTSSATPSKIKLNLKETSYDFIKDRPALTSEYLDLVPFVDPSNLCFSSDGFNLFISTRPECEKCFDNLFDFTSKEEMVYQMFKEQLGDDIKAKKLVLMSKLLNDDTPQNKEPVQKQDKRTVLRVTSGNKKNMRQIG